MLLEVGDLGKGHSYQMEGDEEGNPIGITWIHPDKDGNVCMGYCPFGEGKAWWMKNGHLPGEDNWKMHSRKKLDLTPSVVCRTCGCHGYISHGKYDHWNYEGEKPYGLYGSWDRDWDEMGEFGWWREPKDPGIGSEDLLRKNLPYVPVRPEGSNGSSSVDDDEEDYEVLNVRLTMADTWSEAKRQLHLANNEEILVAWRDGLDFVYKIRRYSGRRKHTQYREPKRHSNLEMGYL